MSFMYAGFHFPQYATTDLKRVGLQVLSSFTSLKVPLARVTFSLKVLKKKST